jgi:hypothetical protein
MDRKNPIEKRVGSYGKQDLQTDASRLAPAWMQQQTPFNIVDGQPQTVSMTPVG